MTQLRQENERIIKQKQQQRDEAITQELKRELEKEKDRYKELEEYIKEERSWRKKPSQTSVQKKTMQPFAITPTPLTEPQKNNTADLKEIPVEEEPAQTSTENKPSPAHKPSITLQTSQPQDFENVNADETPISSLELPNNEHPTETTSSNNSESREDTIEVPDGILLGILHGINEFIKKAYPASNNKTTNEAKKNTKIPYNIPILKAAPLENNKTSNKTTKQKEKKQKDDKTI